MPNVPTSLMTTHTYQYFAFRLLDDFSFSMNHYIKFEPVRSYKLKFQLWKNYDGLSCSISWTFSWVVPSGPPKDTSTLLYLHIDPTYANDWGYSYRMMHARKYQVMGLSWPTIISFLFCHLPFPHPLHMPIFLMVTYSSLFLVGLWIRNHCHCPSPLTNCPKCWWGWWFPPDQELVGDVERDTLSKQNQFHYIAWFDALLHMFMKLLSCSFNRTWCLSCLL